MLVSTHFTSDFNLVLVNLSQGDGFTESGYFTAIQIKNYLYYAHKKSSTLLHLCRVTVTFIILCKTLIRSECEMRSD